MIKSFGQVIGELRQKKGVSQRKLARNLKIAPSYLNEIENGEGNIHKYDKSKQEKSWAGNKLQPEHRPEDECDQQVGEGARCSYHGRTPSPRLEVIGVIRYRFRPAEGEAGKTRNDRHQDGAHGIDMFDRI